MISKISAPQDCTPTGAEWYYYHEANGPFLVLCTSACGIGERGGQGLLWVRANCLRYGPATGLACGPVEAKGRPAGGTTAAALLVATTGYSQVTSRGFSTSELSVVTDALSLDVRVNGPPPNPYWVGEVQLSFTCPSASIWNQSLGRVDLFPVFFDEYNAVQFGVPANVRQVLEGG